MASGYLLAALVVTAGLWPDPNRRYLVHSGQDQRLWEWFFTVVAHGQLLFSTTQNYPHGVNLMANTAMPGLGIPLAPLTLLVGPGATWAVALTGGLASTAYSWYWLFARFFTPLRAGAILAGAFCGFAPPIISHANGGHPNFVVQFVLPLMISRLIQLHRGERPIRNGVLLGLLAAYQIVMGEELLLIAATALAVFAVVWVCTGPTNLRVSGRGVATAAAVFLPLVAYPLWWQFHGQQSNTGLTKGRPGNDIMALGGYGQQSLAGVSQAPPKWLSVGPAENNGFFGWALIVLVVGLSIWLWRDRRVKALAITGALMAMLSLGVSIRFGRHDLGLPGPWRLLVEIPPYGSMIQSRFALACVPVIAAMLALGLERIDNRRVFAAMLAMALLPLAPIPLETTAKTTPPKFISAGTWRHFVRPHHTLVPIPVPRVKDGLALSWVDTAGLGFNLPGGYFVGPDGPSRRGVYGAPPRTLNTVTQLVSRTGQAQPYSGDLARRIRADLRYWRADAVVLPPQPSATALRRTLDILLAQRGRWVDGVWVWSVDS